MTADDLLKEARQYVHIEAARENYHALVTLLQIDQHLKSFEPTIKDPEWQQWGTV